MAQEELPRIGFRLPSIQNSGASTPQLSNNETNTESVKTCRSKDGRMLQDMMISSSIHLPRVKHRKALVETDAEDDDKDDNKQTKTVDRLSDDVFAFYTCSVCSATYVYKPWSSLESLQAMIKDVAPKVAESMPQNFLDLTKQHIAQTLTFLSDPSILSRKAPSSDDRISGAGHPLLQWSTESFSDWPQTVLSHLEGASKSRPRRCSSCKDDRHRHHQKDTSELSVPFPVPIQNGWTNEHPGCKHCGKLTSCDCSSHHPQPAWIKRLVLPATEKFTVYKDTLYLMDVVVNIASFFVIIIICFLRVLCVI